MYEHIKMQIQNNQKQVNRTEGELSEMLAINLKSMMQTALMT